MVWGFAGDPACQALGKTHTHTHTRHSPQGLLLLLLLNPSRVPDSSPAACSRWSPSVSGRPGCRAGTGTGSPLVPASKQPVTPVGEYRGRCPQALFQLCPLPPRPPACLPWWPRPSLPRRPRPQMCRSLLPNSEKPLPSDTPPQLHSKCVFQHLPCAEHWSYQSFRPTGERAHTD